MHVYIMYVRMSIYRERDKWSCHRLRNSACFACNDIDSCTSISLLVGLYYCVSFVSFPVLLCSFAC